MERTLVLIANGAEARLFELEEERLRLLEQHMHPRSRMPTREITGGQTNYRETRTSDRATQTVYGGGYPEPTDAHDHEIEAFARELAKRLDEGRARQEFNALVIAAAPGFHGRLNGHMSDQLHRLVRVHIEKDYTKVPERELPERLRPHLVE